MSEYNLIHGDFYEQVESIKDGSIDLVVTDPPYKLGNVKGGGLYKLVDRNSGEANPYNRKETNAVTQLESLDSADFDAIKFLNLIKPKMKKFYGYFFCNKALISDYLTFAIKNKYSYDILVLIKDNPVPAKNNHFLPDMEYCIMIRESGTCWSKTAQFDDYRKAYRVSCSGKKLHPAEKPVEMLERMIRVSSIEGDIVFDPFMGSGSTGMACLGNNRNFLGIEKNDDYFLLASNRLKTRSDELNGVGTLFEGL